MNNVVHLPHPARVERDQKRAFQADLGVRRSGFAAFRSCHDVGAPRQRHPLGRRSPRSELLWEVRHVLAARGLALALYVPPARPPAPVKGDPGTTLESLGELPFLSVRAHNRLLWHGVKTAGDIAAMWADEQVVIEGLGRMCLVQVRSSPADIGGNAATAASPSAQASARRPTTARTRCSSAFAGSRGRRSTSSEWSANMDRPSRSRGVGRLRESCRWRRDDSVAN